MSSYKYLFKFIIIGDTGVGKSCLVLRFVENKMRSDHEVTIGVEFGAKFVLINKDTIKLQLWDTAGQENFKSITRSYYRSAAAAVVVYDVTNRKSFQNVETWLDDLKSNCSQQICVQLVGNKSDLNQKRSVSFQEGQQLAQKYDLQFIETSAKLGEEVENVFMNSAKLLYKQVEGGQINIVDAAGIKLGSEYHQSTNNKNGQNNKLSNKNQKLKFGSEYDDTQDDDQDQQQESQKKKRCC